MAKWSHLEGSTMPALCRHYAGTMPGKDNQSEDILTYWDRFFSWLLSAACVMIDIWAVDQKVFRLLSCGLVDATRRKRCKLIS